MRIIGTRHAKSIQFLPAIVSVPRRLMKARVSSMPIIMIREQKEADRKIELRISLIFVQMFTMEIYKVLS